MTPIIIVVSRLTYLCFNTFSSTNSASPSVRAFLTSIGYIVILSLSLTFQSLGFKYPGVSVKSGEDVDLGDPPPPTRVKRRTIKLKTDSNASSTSYARSACNTNNTRNTTKAKATAYQLWSFFYTQTGKKRAHQVTSAQNLRFHSRQQRDLQIARGLPLVDIIMWARQYHLIIVMISLWLPLSHIAKYVETKTSYFDVLNKMEIWCKHLKNWKN